MTSDPSGPIEQPNASNTGPRIALDPTVLTGAEALAAAIANGGTLSGRRIAGPMECTQPEHAVTFVDCEFTNALYQVNCWIPSLNPTRPPAGQRLVLDHCRLIGQGGPDEQSSSASNIIGYDFELLNCDLTTAADNVKPYGNNHVFACYMHDTWHWGTTPPDTAHTDNVQVHNGFDFLIEWCTLVGFNHPDSPSNPGSVNSGGLQTGVVQGDLLRWEMNDNWVSGGNITLRAAPSGSGFTIDMVFRRNKHARDFNTAPISGMGTAGVSYDDSNIFIDTGLPVNDGW